MSFVKLASVVLAAAAAARGGLPAVTTSDGSVEVDRTFETALIIAQDGYEHLIIQTGYVVRDGAAAVGDTHSALPRLGWVIAVPDVPRGYAIATDTAIIETWNMLARLSRYAPPSYGGEQPAPIEEGGASSTRLVSVPPVGRYEASVIPTTGGGPSVSHWLAKHGFGPLPEAVLRSYSEAGSSFLGVVVEPDAGARGLPRNGQLGPLRVTIRSDRIAYPVRLAAEDGSFHSYLFIASAEPINLDDASVYGYVPMEGRAVRERLDRLLWQASVSESTRAVLWYGSGGVEGEERMPSPAPGEPKPRDRTIEGWAWSVLDLVAGWHTPIINRRTDFRGAERPDGSTLQGMFALALSENSGNAPPSLASLYRGLVGSVGGRPADSLYVSVLCAPGLNMSSTEADLRRWRDDPEIRLRTLLGALPPLAAPSATPPVDSGYRPPRSVLLPPPSALGAALVRLSRAGDAAAIEREALATISEARRSPRVRLMRELSATGLLGEIASTYRQGEGLHFPTDDPSVSNTRSIQAFERAFRRLIVPLQAVWVAAQETGERPDPVVVFLSLRVHPDGEVEVVRVAGNLPPGQPKALLKHLIERGVRLPPAREDGSWDFAIVVSG